MNNNSYKQFLIKFGMQNSIFEAQNFFDLLEVPVSYQQDFTKLRDNVLKPLTMLSEYRIKFQLQYEGHQLVQVILNQPDQCAFLTYSQVPDLHLNEVEQEALARFTTCYHVEEIMDPQITRRRATLNALNRLSNREFKNYQLAVEKQNEAPVVNPVVKTLVWPGLENRYYA